ncbi:MAG: nucleotidyltransferase substrate binding protein [Deltaproteobacteria bacterium]|nr:nucleotidyltransferase substrate binding protein [Deltaproteobacteria bacterium]
MEGRLKYNIHQYEDAVMNFKDSLSIDFKGFSKKVVDSIKSGRVQKFEFCTELLWKTLKIYLWEVNGIDSRSPKSVIKDFYNLDCLSVEEYEKVMEMLDDRNRLSHIYSHEQFEEIYNRVILTLPTFKKVLDYLRK